MTITIPQQDFHDLFRASRVNQSEQTESFECVSPYSEELGQGFYRMVDLREGIELWFGRYQRHDDLVIQLPERPHIIEYTFCLPENRTSANYYFLYGSGIAPVEAETWQDKAGQFINEVNVHLEPSILQAFWGESFDFKAAGLAHLIQSEPYYYQRTGTPTVAMQTTLHQLLNCPFAGITRKMYLETKVWELMALLIDQELQLSKDPRSPSTLREDDVERIHHAKDILLQNHSSPPSLLDLARQVGLNDCTLKRGFRQVFGTTAFTVLRQARMERAKQLLETEQIGVREAAKMVGYASPTSFSNAFHNTFGVNPRACRVVTSERVI